MGGGIFFMVGVFLLLVGSLVTVVFWVPGVVKRARLRELLGSRYPLVYVVYAANGPGLVLLGVLLLFFLRAQS